MNIMTLQAMKPKISVVMPVYNCGQFLKEALASLLIQTYDDFEIIAINDGSNDDSLDILKKFALLDSRIRIIDQKNTGIVKVLNRGIEQARGDYIARMDSDDVSFPNRFSDQVKILDARPEVILVAGDFEVINHSSEFLYRELVLPENEALKRALYLRNPIAHGSTMFRKSTVKKAGGYRDLFGPTEDVDLWMRLSHMGEFAATATHIYKWRMNQNGLTLSKNGESIRQGKSHIEQRWSEHKPQIINRKELLNNCRHYLTHYKKNGVHYKYDYLTDTGHIAIKLFTHGYYLEGMQQLIIVASTGRIGLKIIYERICLIISGKIKRH